jgi:transposase, IS5 family
MRSIIEEQMKVGEIDISQIQFNLKSRDEIPKLLMGLQYIYINPDLRKLVFKELESVTPPHVNPDVGRIGMTYWKILVMGTLRLACNFDYDKLKEIADNHSTVRQMLGHGVLDFDSMYPLQTIKDNVPLLTPGVLDKINRHVVEHGHRLLGKSETDGFHARCDSFVVETNVHYPTDINLLLDAMRKVITLISVVCAQAGRSDWRQSKNNKRKLKKSYRKAQQLKRSTSQDPKKKAQKEQAIKDAHLNYLLTALSFMKKATSTLKTIDHHPSNIARILAIDHYMKHAHRQINQIMRRVVEGETIEHDEKVFSVFEEHTEWISKGKAGVPQELGRKVCIVEDQYGFIIHHKIMKKQADQEIAIEITEEAKALFGNLSGCSFDKGFYSKENVNELRTILDQVVIPKKGKLSQKQKELESAEPFVSARRQHAAVESAINALENHGLDRCPDKGEYAFFRYISLAVLSRNIQIVGHLLQQKKVTQEKRKQKYRQTVENNRMQAGQPDKAA